MDTNPIKALNRNIMDSQRQALDKGRQMAKILKGKIDWTQHSKTTFLVTIIKRLIIKPVNKFGPPVFSFKQTQEAVRQNSQILAALNRNLGAEI